jgi:hypothetical protein
MHKSLDEERTSKDGNSSYRHHDSCMPLMSGRPNLSLTPAIHSPPQYALNFLLAHLHTCTFSEHFQRRSIGPCCSHSLRESHCFECLAITDCSFRFEDIVTRRQSQDCRYFQYVFPRRSDQSVRYTTIYRWSRQRFRRS